MGVALLTVLVVVGVLTDSASGAGPAPGSPGPPTINEVLAGGNGDVLLRWNPPVSSGTSVIRAYGFERSLDGGTTWSGPVSFGARILLAVSTTYPALVCPNIAPGSKGCRYRIVAGNLSGFGTPSNSVATWIAPSAPLAVSGVPGGSFDAVALHWPVPRVTGGLPLTYTATASMDGGPAQVVANTAFNSATAPCTGAVSCTYRVTAKNSQGTSASSPALVIRTAPTVVSAASARVSAFDLGSGVSTAQVQWSAPGGGMPAVSYDFEDCILPVGTPTGCTATAGWSPPTVMAATAGTSQLADTCPSGVSTCLYRVRARNTRNGTSAWLVFGLSPWAPFGVRVAAGRAHGTVTVSFNGPAESGQGANSAKRYVVYSCARNCGTPSQWHNAGLTVTYPPAGSAPFVAGSFVCGTPSISCKVRMRFVDGLGQPGPASALASGFPRP